MSASYEEKCGCGASIAITDLALYDSTMKRVQEWREGHQHMKTEQRTSGPPYVEYAGTAQTERARPIGFMAHEWDPIVS